MIENGNLIVALLIVILPPVLGLCVEIYNYIKKRKYLKQKHEHDDENILSFSKIVNAHFRQMFLDSIFKYLDPQVTSNEEQQQQDDDNSLLRHEDRRHVYINPEGNQSCFNQCSSINRDAQLDQQNEDLNQPLIEQGQNQNNQRLKANLDYYKARFYFYLIFVSNIITVPLIYSLSLINNMKRQQEFIPFIFQAIILMVLHFSLNFTMFLYGSIITTQSSLLLIYLRKKEDEIRMYLQSCINRSLFFSVIFFLAQLILFTVQLIEGCYDIELLHKFPLILIGRYIASFYISMNLKRSFSNQKIFKKRRLESLYKKFYTKYFDETILEQELIKKVGENPTPEQQERFLENKYKQSIQYLEKMEKNLTQNKDFKMDQILTNKHSGKQFSLITNFLCIFVFIQLALMGIAIYFLCIQIQFSYFSNLSNKDYDMSQFSDSAKFSQNDNFFSNMSTIKQVQQYYYQGYYLKDSYDDIFIEYNSGALTTFNSFILVQALLMIFARKSLFTKFILNENTRNRLLV